MNDSKTLNAPVPDGSQPREQLRKEWLAWMTMHAPQDLRSRQFLACCMAMEAGVAPPITQRWDAGALYARDEVEKRRRAGTLR